MLGMEINLTQEQERIAMENNLEAWCERLLEMQFEVWPFSDVFHDEFQRLTNG
jgi:hypothetical protein